jgi:hypothetical protein
MNAEAKNHPTNPTHDYFMDIGEHDTVVVDDDGIGYTVYLARCVHGARLADCPDREWDGIVRGPVE